MRPQKLYRGAKEYSEFFCYRLHHQTMSLNRPLVRTTKSTATLIRDSALPVELTELILTKSEGTSLTVQSTGDKSIVTEGGIDIGGLALFQQLAQFNQQVTLNHPDFILCLGPPEHEGTWRVRIRQGYLLFEKYDSLSSQYITRFQLY